MPPVLCTPCPQSPLSSRVSPQAVCCSDGQHCCPQGTTCDLIHSTCTSLGGSAPLAALPTGETPPGGNHPLSCPGEGTPALSVPCPQCVMSSVTRRRAVPMGTRAAGSARGPGGAAPLSRYRGVPCAPQDKQMSPVSLRGMRAAVSCSPEKDEGGGSLYSPRTRFDVPCPSWEGQGGGSPVPLWDWEMSPVPQEGSHSLMSHRDGGDTESL